MSVLFGLFGFVSLSFLAILLSSRYFLDVVLRLLTAHREGLRAYHEARVRSLKYERLALRVMG